MKRHKKLQPFLFLLFAFTILVSFSSVENNKVRYHEIEYTASSVELVKWNISDTLNKAFVKEIIDQLGRTKELRFYNIKHELDWAGSGFWGGPIIKYDYEKNKIIETFFSSENNIANDFKTSEVPYRNIYFLNDENQIVKVKQIYKIDFEFSRESLEQTIKHLKFYEQYTTDDPEPSYDLENVFGYHYAYAKMNGIDPKSKH